MRLFGSGPAEENALGAGVPEFQQPANAGRESGSPAVLEIFLRPEALRPHLSAGLPLSEFEYHRKSNYRQCNCYAIQQRRAVSVDQVTVRVIGPKKWLNMTNHTDTASAVPALS